VRLGPGGDRRYTGRFHAAVGPPLCLGERHERSVRTTEMAGNCAASFGFQAVLLLAAGAGRGRAEGRTTSLLP
jgi:hypothetical protein